MRQRLSSNALVYLPTETSSASAEGTLAAANLVVDRGIKALLESSCKRPSNVLQHFSALLRVDTLGGASTQMEIIGCHAR